MFTRVCLCSLRIVTFTVSLLALSSSTFGGLEYEFSTPRPQNEPGGKGGVPSEKPQTSMTGCLKKGTEENTYILTDLEKGPKSIGIVSSSANLAPHVGQKVELTGTAVPAKDAEADSKVPKANRYMKISAVKMISPTCP